MARVILSTTNPTLLLNPNKSRRYLLIQMLATSVAAGNTGRVHIGRGFQPVATVGHELQGEILIQSAAIEEKKQVAQDPLPFKGPIWATSSATNQELEVQEFLEESLA